MSQLSKSLLKWEILKSLYHLCGPALALLQNVHVSPVLESPALNPALQMCLISAEERGKDQLPEPAGDLLSIAAHGAVGLCCKGTELGHGQFVTQQEAQSLFCRAHFQSFIPQCVLENGAVPPQVQDFAFHITALPEVPFSPFLQPIEIILDGSTATSFINCSSQFCVSSRLWSIRNIKVWAQAVPYQLNSEPERERAHAYFIDWLMCMQPQRLRCAVGEFSCSRNSSVLFRYLK